MDLNNKPIGIFDSGMGGLTVLKALKSALPKESFIYLGDTARLPYGTKSPKTILAYARQAAKCLLAHQVKMLIIACNTASMAALDSLRKALPDIPIIGVIEPGIERVCETLQQHKTPTYILSTEATMESGVYECGIKARYPDLEIRSISAGLLVPLAEAGHTQDEIATCILRHYFMRIDQTQAGLILLGCTHFPVFTHLMREMLGARFEILDSATTVASHVSKMLVDSVLEAEGNPFQSIRYLVTDCPKRFSSIGKIFLGETISTTQIEQVDLSC